jgi:hypothetical protein
MAKETRHDGYAYDTKYEASETQKHRRALRNKARRKAIREGRASKGDGMDVHHIEGIDGPIRMVSASKNRSWK